LKCVCVCVSGLGQDKVRTSGARSRVLHPREMHERGQRMQKWHFDSGKHRRDNSGLLECAPSLTHDWSGQTKCPDTGRENQGEGKIRACIHIKQGKHDTLKENCGFIQCVLECLIEVRAQRSACACPSTSRAAPNRHVQGRE